MKEIAVHSNWALGAIGFLVGLVLSFTLIALAPFLGWVDHPDQGRKNHHKPTARTGGLALWGVLILAQVMGWLPWDLHPGDWVGIHCMAVMGAVDDRFDLRARYKAVLGLAVAMLLAVHASGILQKAVGHVDFMGLAIPTFPLLTFPFLLAWFWSIPHAYNLIDGINGLSMGFGLLALGAVGWHSSGQPAVLWGGLAAILVLNFPQAKHFLGDCGALLLGTLYATLGVQLLVARNADLPVWIFAYPIVDVTLVVAIRFWRGQPLGQADRSHLHHWMMDRVGQRAWIATPLLLVFAALPMFRVADFPGARAISSMGALALGLLAMKAFLDRVLPEPAREEGVARVRREIPILGEASLREPSGSHRIH